MHAWVWLHGGSTASTCRGLNMCSYIFIAVDPEDDFTFSASDEEDDTQLARAIADDMGYVLNTLFVLNLFGLSSSRKYLILRKCRSRLG